MTFAKCLPLVGIWKRIFTVKFPQPPLLFWFFGGTPPALPRWTYKVCSLTNIQFFLQGRGGVGAGTRGSGGRPRGRPRLHNLGSRGPRGTTAATTGHNGVGRGAKKFPCSDDDDDSDEDEEDGDGDGAEDVGGSATAGEAVEAANQGRNSIALLKSQQTSQQSF